MQRPPETDRCRQNGDLSIFGNEKPAKELARLFELPELEEDKDRLYHVAEYLKDVLRGLLKRSAAAMEGELQRFPATRANNFNYFTHMRFEDHDFPWDSKKLWKEEGPDGEVSEEWEVGGPVTEGAWQRIRAS